MIDLSLCILPSLITIQPLVLISSATWSKFPRLWLSTGNLLEMQWWIKQCCQENFFWGFLILMPDAFFRNVRYILILRTAVVNVWHYYIMYDWGFFKGRKCCKLLWLWLAFTNTIWFRTLNHIRRNHKNRPTRIPLFALLPPEKRRKKRDMENRA